MNGVIMSNNWVQDINDMHRKFGVHDWFEANKDNKELMDKYLRFRLSISRRLMDQSSYLLSRSNLGVRDPSYSFRSTFSLWKISVSCPSITLFRAVSNKVFQFDQG